MPPKNENDLQKHTLWLRKGDYEKLKKLSPEFGAAPIVRELVSDYIDQLETFADGVFDDR